jgi:hypothetical protein
MHNCRATRERIAELLSSGVESPHVEIFGCEACRSEFDALKATLRLSMRAIESVTPHDDYWAGYQSRLRSKLIEVKAESQRTRGWLSILFTSSIRVPVPVLVLILVAVVMGAAVFTLVKKQNVSTPSIVSVIQVPVEVPVVKEKIVTQVIYRKPKMRVLSRRAPSQVINSTFAKSQPASTSLSGFKPLEEVKLTVIKGGTPDEK